MFEKLKLSEWLLEDYGSEYGLIKANYDFLKDNHVANVFTKEKKLYELIQVGNMDFDELDQFIKKAMNTYDGL